MSDPVGEDKQHPEKTAARQLGVVIGIFAIATIAVAIIVGLMVTQ